MIRLALLSCLVGGFQVAAAADWPQWRYDAGRTSTTSDTLPDELHLQWTRELRPQVPAWKDDRGLMFDRTHKPVVLGKLLFLGSTVNDALTAYGIESGAEKWRFYTDGPVRVATVAWKGKVLVGSDDGHLYCLRAADGKLEWKVCGSPSRRLLIGNQRLISTWPVRGGPVLVDGTIYFAAGVWPFMGTFIHAVEAKSGRILWTNDSTSFTYRDDLPHPGAAGFSGLSPQGHLAVARDRLIVPGSRGKPAVLDRHSGEFLFYAKDGNVLSSPKKGTPLLRAGSRHVVYNRGRIELLDISESRVLWQTPVEGKVTSALAASGKLFIVTLDAIHCFGRKPGRPQTHKPQEPTGVSSAAWEQKAKDILQLTGVREGYCLLWGLKDRGLCEELVRQSQLHVVAVGPHAEKVLSLRRRLDAAGLYGTRCAALVADPSALNLAPHFASLIVCEDLEARFVKKLYHPLRPYGGVACLKLDSKKRSTFEDWVKEASLPGAKLERRGSYSLLIRAGALPGSADWLGQNADAANTRCSRDQLVKAPLGVLWFGNALSNQLILPRHGEGPVEQVVAGRMIIEGDNSLSASDVYTGRLLWTREFPDLGKYYKTTKHQRGAHVIGSNFFAVADAVYVAHGKKCHVLDSATGKTRKELTLPLRSDWQFLLVYGDLLIAGSHPTVVPDDPSARILRYNTPASSHRLVVMRRQTGKVLWTREAAEDFPHYGIAAGAGKVFCIDRISAARIKQLERRGQEPQETPRILALDAHSGDLVWQSEKGVASALSYSDEHDVVLSGGALRGQDGELLWYDPEVAEKIWRGKWGPVLRGKTFLTQGGLEFDILTGKQRLEWKIRRTHGCGPMAGSGHLMTFRSGCAAYFDLTNDSGTANLGGFKSGCTSNLIVANGVLNAPDYTRTCHCAYQNRSSLGLIHTKEVEYWTFGAKASPGRVGFNFGAPGDRRGPNGTLWKGKPPVTLEPEDAKRFYRHSLRMEGGEGLLWVASSGVSGVRRMQLPLDGIRTDQELVVRLYFSEPKHTKAGKRVFSVRLNGKTLIEDLDVVKKAGGPFRALVKEFPGIRYSAALELTFKAVAGEPLICGVEVQAQ